jgi:hypothetical protein
MSSGDSSDRQTAFGMAQLRFAYLQAAHALRNTSLNFSHPLYALICQAIELLLKSWLRSHGYHIHELKKIGHNLTDLHVLARSGRVPLAMDEQHLTGVIQLLSPVHEKRLFSYLEIGARTYPTDFNDIVEGIEKLWLEVYPVAYRASYRKEVPRPAERLPRDQAPTDEATS